MTQQPFVTRPGLGRGDTSAELPTLVSIVRHHAEHFPDDTAITFLIDGDSKKDVITYGELDRRARAIAALILQRAKPGDRALLLFPPGMHYITAFFGALYAGVIAVPAYPPDPSPARLKRTLPRLQAIVADSGSSVILTDSMIARMAKALLVHAPEFASMAWVPTDTLDSGLEESWEHPRIYGDSIAFLQYTSGSTGVPRGVMLTHRNLLAEVEVVHHKFGHVPNSIATHWLPPYHDMGLIGAILTPVHGGFPALLMSPMAFLRRPIRWLKAIASTPELRVSAGGPNFAFELILRKTTMEQRAALDLRNWKVAYTGAEPIRAATLRNFQDGFAVSGFEPTFHYPCYGLAEATLLVTGADHWGTAVTESFDADALQRRQLAPPASAETTRELVSSGSVGKAHTLAIVDPDTLTRCADDAIGELWVQGPIVAKGYWNMPERSEREFRARIAGEDAGGTWLRTGDLAFIRDGEVFIAGRIKDMVIIRGQNLYPQDLEEVVEEAHRYVRKGCIAAFGFDKNGAEALGIVTEVDARDASFDPDEVIAAIRKTVASHFQVVAEAVVLIAAKSIPKTSSGKIQRHAAKQGFIDGSLDQVGAVTA